MPHANSHLRRRFRKLAATPSFNFTWQPSRSKQKQDTVPLPLWAAMTVAATAIDRHAERGHDPASSPNDHTS